ncbi:hypothetical protein BurJ1DRAFT_1770 [Burkholderiales bacterium JOSHI_001]|nr:hypothetical protein BurJ1DRAFT_1770 [Burkholderiales bacterium JOSHI_001]
MAEPARQDRCRVCGQAARHLFDGPLLGHRVAYFECPQCGYVQTENPHWLAEAYASSAINTTDTGILRRNERNVQLVVRVLSVLGRLKGRVLDCAGGWGLLVRMLRDRGVDARWTDAYAQNLVARGFEWRDADGPAALVTAFEAMEHFVDPLAELQRLAQHGDLILVSTSLIPQPSPPPGQWWYYGSEHGQHIGFFRLQTLRWLAARMGWHLNSDGKAFHLFSARPVPAWRWRWARHSKRLAGLTARLRLRSLMWADHHALSRPAADAPRHERSASEPWA